MSLALYLHLMLYHLEKDDSECVDISTWGDLKFKKVEKEHCKVEYKKITEKKEEKVCLEINHGLDFEYIYRNSIT